MHAIYCIEIYKGERGGVGGWLNNMLKLQIKPNALTSLSFLGLSIFSGIKDTENRRVKLAGI